MTTTLIPFCAMKQGRFQWGNWSQRIITVDMVTGCVWVSKKDREDMPYYHKLAVGSVQPWKVYKEKYIDEEANTRKAMLTVRLKCYDVPATPQEKFNVQRRLLGGNTSLDTPPHAVSSSENSSSEVSALVTRGDTVDIVLRFTSTEALYEFTTAMQQLLVKRGDADGAAQVGVARDRAIAALQQLSVKRNTKAVFTDLV